MFERFFAPYSSLLLGVELLLRNPVAWSAVEVLRALTLLLCTAAGARIAAHCIADRRLRRRSPVYGPDEFSGLYDLYREAGRRVGLKRLPPLRRQADEDPLAFTTGCFRPAIFLAPALIRALGADELGRIAPGRHRCTSAPRRDRDRGAWSDRSGHTRVRNTCGGRSERSLGLDPDARFHRYAHTVFDVIVGIWLADWLLRRSTESRPSNRSWVASTGWCFTMERS